MTLDEAIEKLKKIKEELGSGRAIVKQVIFPKIIPINDIKIVTWGGAKHVEIT